jgi:hypothetical protein
MRPHKQIGPTVPQVVGGAIPATREDGGRRRGKALKQQPRTNSLVRAITLEQVKDAREIDPHVQYDRKRKMLIYRREV